MCEIRINQFTEVAKRLKEDPDSRQGTIVIFDPARDFLPTKDVPCTNLMRFSIRENKLNMMVVMRSNDLWFGYPYDVFNFTVLQEMMAGLLDVEVGKYTHVVDSLHLYDIHFEQAKKIIENSYDGVYKENKLIDARGFSDEDLSLAYNAEHLTRETGDSVDVEFISETLDKISNEYWKSLAAVLAVYNFKKAKRSEEEVNLLREKITNEFNGLL
ncbi:Thymidylate synthase [compost metagenome]